MTELLIVAVAIFGFAMVSERLAMSPSVLDGNGFIAAFTAGLTFGQIARNQCGGIQDFTEDEGELLSAITFMIFGAVLIGPLLDQLSWRTAVYVLASLTVVRMVPVFVAMARSGTFVETRLFLGWFGPRGLASILFALIVVEELDHPAGQTVFNVAAWTVLSSVFLHGLSANLWAGRLANRLAAEQDPMPENQPVDEMRTRRVIGRGLGTMPTEQDPR